MSLIEWTNITDNVTGTAQDVIIVLPHTISPSRPVERTLYLLHGLTGSARTWLLNCPLRQLAQDFDTAVICPGGGRSFWVDEKHGRPYGRWLKEELPQLIESILQIPARGSAVAIAGMSMGGYGAVKAVLDNPGQYAACVSLSGTLDVTEAAFQSRHPDLFSDIFGIEDVRNTEYDLVSRVLQSGWSEDVALYLSCGTEDRLLEQNRCFANAASQALAEGPGAHNFKFWNPRLWEGLQTVENRWG